MVGQKRDTFQGTLDMLGLKALAARADARLGHHQLIEQWSEQILLLGQGTLIPRCTVSSVRATSSRRMEGHREQPQARGTTR